MKRILVLCISVIVILSLTSCASTLGAYNNAPEFIPVAKKDVKITGPVKVQYTTHGILGIIPEISLFSWGDKSSYVALLDEAGKLGADDVVNIKVDLISTNVFIFYNERTWVASGLAVKYLDGVANQAEN